MAKVFISYRRDDSAGHAGRVHDRLEREFGRNLLFMDVDAIPLGVNFARVLGEEVGRCDVLLAVIGPGWLEARDEAGLRRLDSPHDFVRIEIAAALKRDIPVIPILLEGTRMPRSDHLPGDIQELTLRNALDVRHASFHADMDKLVRSLKASGGQAQPPVEDLEGLVRRGTNYLYGENGVAKDEHEAVRLYTLAAEQGNDAAQFYLGSCYDNGTGVAQDEREAVRLYTLAAEQGYAFAQFILGVRYDTGTGVARDEREAVRLFKLAAQQGHTGAQFHLGVHYQYGRGVAKDERESVRFYKLAAEQGNAAAQFKLGACYETGTGVAKDEREAVRLYKLVAAQGDTDAVAALKRLGHQP